MFDRVEILRPMLDTAVQAKSVRWPTYDGAYLDRTKFVTSSEIGKCARMVWYSKNVPLSEGMFMWGYAERGHAVEAWVVDKLTKSNDDLGYDFAYLGDDQVSFYDEYQSGTPDGLFYNEYAWNQFEFKSIDPRVRLDSLPKKEHLKQAVQNMDLVEACLDIDLKGTLLAYINASNFGLITEFWIDRNSRNVGKMMVDLQNRAEAIMTAKSADDLAPEGISTGDCKYCAFTAQCSGAILAQRAEKERYGKLEKVAKGFG